MKKQPNIPLFNVMLLAIYLLAIVSCQPRAAKVQVAESASFKFEEQDIQQIQQGYKDGIFTVQEVVQAYLDRIDSIDKHGPQLNAMITLNPDA
ncbi:MAG TPA: hypothetical protein VFC67_00970, partial [Prolixibacteraceae bacterium]|nr:hypothetical protein [Prolixibacteraceae bacterium]